MMSIKDSTRLFSSSARQSYLWAPHAAVMIVLAIATSAMAQQQSPFPGISGPGDITGQGNCDNLFVPCTNAGSLGSGNDVGGGGNNRQGSGNTGSSPFSSSDVPQNYDIDNSYYFGSTAPLPPQSLQPNPEVHPGPQPATQTMRRQEPPTEFQLFVAGSIGKMLPLFGRRLFLDVPTTFAPTNRGPVPPEYTVGPGDELLMHAWGSVNFNIREHVDRDGNIYLPHFGELRVAGMKFSDIQPLIAGRIGEEFRKFDLSVSMGQLRSIQVLVVGRARRPGSYTVSSLSTLVNVIFASGGPLPSGSMRRIELRRGGKTVTTLDLYQLLAEGDESKDAPLLSGDVIFIPPAGPTVALAGSVSQPAIYELRPGDTIADALNLAGGVTSIAALQRASLERIGSDGERHVLDVTLNSQGTTTPLTNGDVLRVFQIVPKFDDAVILRGNVANPGRYAWHQGMRITDLIPDKESLITRNYWKGHNSLALTDDESANARRIEASALASSEGRNPQKSGDSKQSAPAAAGNDASQENDNSSAQNSTGVPVPSGRSISDRQPVAVRNQEDSTPDSSSSTGRSIAFDSGRPSEDFPRVNDVERAAPAIDWDYAVIERTNPTNLARVLKPFHLGRVVLDHDQSEDYLLQPGDVVTVFSQADISVPDRHQTKIVRLEGEFGEAGIYTVEPGETLRDLVKRAGGFTSDAYLFGSSFTRRSTRLQEQARLDQYTVELEQEIDREAGNKSETIINPQEAAVTAASIESQRALVTKLRQIRATGRIVLNIDPNSTDVSSVPDLPLEDGDIFRVPTRPSSISVVGAVYDQNSFLFEPASKVDHYLQLSGGVTKAGDWKHSFVIRADGSVVSHQSLLAHESHGLEHFELNPGDALIVPEQLNKGTLLRGLTDWSQIFAQFGLGAAAINVLH